MVLLRGPPGDAGQGAPELRGAAPQDARRHQEGGPKDPKFSNATLQSLRFRNVAFLNLKGSCRVTHLGREERFRTMRGATTRPPR